MRMRSVSIHKKLEKSIRPAEIICKGKDMKIGRFDEMSFTPEKIDRQV